MIKHIAEHFQTELSKATYENLYSIQYVNNQGHLRDIRRNATIYDQLNQPTDTVMIDGKEVEKPVTQVFITADSGSYVALKDIQTTSFSFTMEFDVNVDINPENDLQAFIQAINGYIRTQNGYNFVCTFNEPTISPTRDRNGNTYYTLSIFGSVAITNNAGSSFGNELAVKISTFNTTGLIDVTGILSSDITVTRQGRTYSKSGKITPKKTIEHYEQSVSLVIHGRKDDQIISDLIWASLQPRKIVDGDWRLSLTLNGHSDTFYVVVDNITIEASIGGYVVLNVTLSNTVI